MSVELRLLIFGNELMGNTSDINYSHEILSVSNQDELWNMIEYTESVYGEPVPNHFSSFVGRDSDGNTAYGETTETPYGEPLKWIQVKHLKKLSNYSGIINNWKNRAAWAYLKECPNHLGVALYWH